MKYQYSKQEIIRIARGCKNWIIDDPIKSSCSALLVAIAIIVIVTGFWDSLSGMFFKNTKWGLYNRTFWESVLVEAHGMLLDILVFGVLLVWIAKKRENRLEVKRYIEEIDDFRGWKSEEAVRRIRGNILRLNRLGKTDIDLHHCFLKGADLRRANLRGAKLTGAVLEDAKFWMADLSDSKLWSANLEGASLYEANLQGADLWRAKLKGAKVYSEMLAEVKSLYEAELDSTLMEDLKNEQPALFEKPHDFNMIQRDMEIMFEGYTL